jgi:hypothetical protein
METKKISAIERLSEETIMKRAELRIPNPVQVCAHACVIVLARLPIAVSLYILFNKYTRKGVDLRRPYSSDSVFGTTLTD